jgi:hypothetical protein
MKPQSLHVRFLRLAYESKAKVLKEGKRPREWRKGKGATPKRRKAQRVSTKWWQPFPCSLLRAALKIADEAGTCAQFIASMPYRLVVQRDVNGR